MCVLREIGEGERNRECVGGREGEKKKGGWCLCCDGQERKDNEGKWVREVEGNEREKLYIYIYINSRGRESCKGGKLAEGKERGGG